jgi:hypothetical protein
LYVLVFQKHILVGAKAEINFFLEESHWCRSLHVFAVAEVYLSSLLVAEAPLQKLKCHCRCRNLHVFAVAEVYLSLLLVA